MVESLSRMSYFIAVRRGLALPLPLIMIGALIQLVRFPPSERLRQFLDGMFGHGLETFCDNLLAGTFGIASLVALYGFTDALVNLHNQRRGQRLVSPGAACMVVVACFFIMKAPIGETTLVESLSLGKGLLGALLVASIASGLFLKLCGLRSLRIPVRNLSNDPVIGDIFAIMPAGMLTILLFGLFKTLWLWAGWPDIIDMLNGLLAVPFSYGSDSLLFALGYTVATQALWLLGIHGPNALYSVQDKMLIPATDANVAAVAAGHDPQFTFTSQFFDFFVRMGGSGSTLCLILAILVTTRTARYQKLAFLMLLPALFNINEPLLFGLPLVLNPVYAVPFVLVPLVQTVISYAAIAADLMPKTGYNVVWTTPAVYSGYAVTGSVSGALVQTVGLVVGTAIYIPFVRLAAHLIWKRSTEVLASLLQIAEARDAGLRARRYLDLPGDEGRMAIALGSDLEDAFQAKDQIFLEYQPQVDIERGRVFGAEALVRWQHPLFGCVAPPILITLAEDLGYMNRLGMKILSIACRQRAAWRDVLPDDFVISVNLSPRQLLDRELDRKVVEVLERENLPPAMLELEITESTVLLPDVLAFDSLRRLRELGVRVAVDDFGMGNTSLHFLRELPLNTVKLDRSLASLDSEGINEHIVESIVNLCRTLDLSVVVEGVQTEAQLRRLVNLRCDCFQGYFFSKPLGDAECLAFIQSYDAKRQRQAEPIL